jgi:hypothetical protein
LQLTAYYAVNDNFVALEEIGPPALREHLEEGARSLPGEREKVPS